MGHSLIRVKGSLVNTPHLIESNSFNSIMEYVNKRIEGNAEITPKMFDDEGDEDQAVSGNYNPETKTGFLSVNGPTTYRRTGWEALCGGTSYESLKEQMESFVQLGAKTVVMDVSSGGGEAHGMLDSANYIRQLANDNGIYIVGFADGSACSAAYGLISIADEVVATVDSSIGSVGVLISLTNPSKALEKEGYERTFVTAGKSKVPFADDGSFRPDFIQRLQTQVDELYDRFTDHVAFHRGLSQQDVKNTEADVFSAKEALDIGLIDSIKTFEQFDDYLVELSSKRNQEGATVSKDNFLNRFKLGKKEDKKEMASLDALKVELDAQLLAQLEDKEAALSASLEQVAQLQGNVSTLTASLTEMQANLESLQAFAEEHKAAASAAQAEAARITEEQAQAKADQRKASLAAVIPADQLEATFGALASLEDDAFSLIVSQYAAAKEVRAESFKAVGGEGVEQDSPVVEQDSVETIRQAGVAKARERYAK